MAITASGLFLLTYEKQAIDTLGLSLESDTALSFALVEDSITPNFDTHDFWNDLESGEASGTGYTAGGATITGTEITNSSGISIFDFTDPSWSTSTIPDVMGGVVYFDRGGATTADELYCLLDFVSAASSSGGTFLVEIAAGGAVRLANP